MRVSPPVERHVHTVQDGAGRGGRGVPGPLARDRIGVERPAPRLHQSPYAGDVGGVVGEGELLLRGVSPLEMLDRREELGIVAQRARDRAEPPHVLGMVPPGIVTPAIGM